MGLFSNKTSDDRQKDQKFREFEKDFSDSPITLASVKATWLTSRANHNVQAGDLDNAIQGFKDAIAVNPYHCPAYLGLAVAYKVQGRFDEAIDILGEAPKVVSDGEHKTDNRFDIYYHLGFVYMEKGDVKQTADAFESAIKFEKGSRYKTSPELLDENDTAEHHEELTQIKEWITEHRNHKN